MSAPKVSVIVPVYNVEAYLPKCLESLETQTLSDIEIICIDDASTDASAQVVRNFQQKDPRIQLLQQEHAGVSAARNLGIAHAQGTYISFVDSDDWMSPEALEKLVETAEFKNADMVVCSAKVHFEQQNPHDQRRNNSLIRALTVAEGCEHGNPWIALSRTGSWPFLWNKLIRRDLITTHNICFSPSLALGEDGAFLVLLFQYADRIYYIPDFLYHYRYLRKASATVKLFKSQHTRFSQHIQVVRVLLEEFKSRNLLASREDKILNWIIQFLYYDFAHLSGPEKKGFSQTLHNLYNMYDLKNCERSLQLIERKRLKKLITPVNHSKVRYLYNLIELKIDNRILRFLRRNHKNE